MLAVGGAAFMLALAPRVSAHRAKSVLTLVRWNRAAGLLEIDHALHAHDGEVALNQIERVATPDLTQVKDQARLVLYTAARFTLTPPDAGPLALKMVGAELVRDYLHVYQEASLTQKPPRLTVHDGILRDVFRTQVNQVNFDMADGDPDHIRTVTFIGGDGDKDVVFDA
jgi:hypothetical protein